MEENYQGTTEVTTTETEVNEEAVESGDETPQEKKDAMKQYKLMVDMLKEMDYQYQMMKEYSISIIRENYNFNENILTNILGYTKEDINAMDESKLMLFFAKYSIDHDKINGIIDDYVNEDNKERVDAERFIINHVKELSNGLLKTKAEADELKKESSDIMNDYFNYLSSPEVQTARKNRLESMKKLAAEETNEIEKKKITKMIESIEATQTLAFLFTRFNKYGETEINNIKNAFFDERKGSYIIEKFKASVKHFGFNDNLYHYFFNLEENFLGEDYYKYNNLFLFVYMRFVAYSDPYNESEKMFVQAVTSTLANLIYHKFNTVENETEFINVIKTVDNKFDMYADYFQSNNTTNPEHPLRKAAEEKREAERKASLIAKMDEMNITGYDTSWTANELQSYFNEKTDELIKEQTAETADTVIVNHDEETSEVTIEPNLEAETSEVYDEVVKTEEECTESVDCQPAEESI